MDLTLTAEQDDFRSALRRLLSTRAGSAEIRAAIERETGFDHELWRRLAELGALALVVPESYGGAGAGHVERALAAEELGRSVAPAPFLASAGFVVDTLLALGDDDASARLLPAIAAGEIIGALAVTEGGGVFETGAGDTRATSSGDGWRLSGAKWPVVAGDVADVLLVHADTDDGPALFEVATDADGLTRTPWRSLDPTRRLIRVQFADTPAIRLTGDAAEALRVAARSGAVLLAAEQVGVMQRALEMAVDYAKVRVQFGRPIGSYQAVKHSCADMYVACEQAYSAVRYATWVADHDPARLPLAAEVCSVYVAPHCFEVARSMLLIHGGIGYTWEHDAHFFYKRAKADELLLGAPRDAQLRLADLVASEPA